MNKYPFVISLVILLGAYLLNGCAKADTQVTGTPAQSIDTLPMRTSIPEITPTMEASDSPTSEPTSEAKATDEPLVPEGEMPTQSPIVIQVAEGDGINHELVFAIRNAGRYSGEAGYPAWLGWGSGNFTVAPEGSFWIADDAADPDRLLHYSPQGDLLDIFSMKIGDQQYYARDLAVDSTGIWVLDYVNQPNLVIHLSLEGNLLGKYEIPEAFATYMQEENISPGLWHIPFVEGGKILLDGPAGIVEFTVIDSKPNFKKVDSYPLGGRLFTEVENGILVDNLRVGMQFLQPDHFLNDVWLLGVASDGSFYVRVDEVNKDQGIREPTDQYVRRYSSTGELLGITLLPLPEISTSHDCIVGPDGSVYTMLSRADHAVEILRLRFTTGAIPLLSPFTEIPQPSFTPLLPSGNVPDTEADAARESMLNFYTSLAEQRYEDAALLFGGKYDEYVKMDAAISPSQPGMAWQLICQMEFCWAVSDILDTRQISPDAYEFFVGFVSDNGGRFDYSICCGNFQPIPPIRWFVYSVTVQKVNEQWLVTDGPFPLP